MYVYKTGKGLINSTINKLPFEAHLPGGYQFCGPGTRLQERLSKDQVGINPLDAACKLHDIAYAQNNSNEARFRADKQLSSEAWKRVKSKDASLGERATALAVTAAMKTKIGLSKLGAGFRKNVKKKQKKPAKKKNSTTKKCCTFNGLVKQAKIAMKKNRPTTSNEILNCALAAAKHVTKSQKNKISVPRIIPIPKTGGLLPLVPIFAGLSALGTLVGGTASIVRAIGAAKAAKNELKEGRRHNRTMESIAIGASPRGEGLYLRPYKTGYGLYLQPYPQTKN